MASFGANAFRGEDGIGEWTLRIVDEATYDVGTLDAAKITLHGTDGGQAVNDLTADVYHYTNEVFTALAREADRIELNDTDGGSDWIDAAAMASNLVVRLGGGETSTAGGVVFIHIADGAEIENAVTGDGNDELYGNDLDNKLYGMRGNDTLNGGLGNDTLSGGAGNDTLTGGAGQDNFLFDRALGAGNVDIITEFSHIDDSISLDGSIFTSLAALVAGGLWVSSVFYSGAALDGHGDAYLLYDFSAGALYYDADGLASTDDAVLFATFAAGSIPLDLSFDDFQVVSSVPAAMGYAEDRPEGFDPVSVDITDIPGADIGGLIIGTDFEDTILTKVTEDRIFGKGGNDYISTGGGNDFVDGGLGRDRIYGGDGDDILLGGGTDGYDGTYFPFEDHGETIDGGNGNDYIEGSDQPNDWTYFYSAGYDDLLYGGMGNDVIRAKNGDDLLLADALMDENGFDIHTGGNDILYGGAGSDTIIGGFGDDRIYAGTGRQNWVIGDVQRALYEGEVGGIDTVVFEGNFNDYVMTGWALDSSNILQVSRVTPDEQENTLFTWQDIEYLEFKDLTLDLRERPLFYSKAFEFNEADRDVVFNANGYEIAASLTNADNVTITDSGAENGGKDRLHTVNLQNVTGDVEINSDAVGLVRVSGLPDDDYNPLNNPVFDGSVTINAAAGERTLNLYLYGVNLDAGERISDDTATELILLAGGKEVWGTHANGAAADDYNLSFASASSIIVKQNSGNLTIKWFVPSATSIDMDVSWPEIVGFDDDMNGGNFGVITIETALDDKFFATAGGSDGYEFIGGGGVEFVRFGNLGLVNASNDGTVSGMQDANEGLGLRGHIQGVNEAWILGTNAFQVNSVTGEKGTVSAGEFTANGTDVVRMTFAVAAAIEDISDYISGFEYVQFDVTSEGRTVDTGKFDDLTQVIVRGYSGVAGENTVELLDGSTVVIKSVGADDNFGTLHLNGSSASLTLSFVDLWKDTDPFLVSAGVIQEQSLAEGTIHVRDAEFVNIKTDSRNDLFAATTLYDRSAPTLDSFGQVLDLDAATTVTITGDTGWDFTVQGTNISHVTTIDASGITGTGTVGGVTASAQTSDAVNFKGGKGNDVFAGGAGNDTLDGGAGFDTVMLSGGRADYLFEFVGGALRVTDTRGGAPDGIDTLRNIERIEFSDGTSIGTGADFTGPPADIMASASSVDENSANGTIVATLSTLDPDSADTNFTYSIRYDRWSAFSIEGDKLVVADSFAFDYEGLKASGLEGRISVTVRATDLSGKFVDKELSFWVGDVIGEHVIGNDVRNVLWGGEGDDYFEGRGGDDYLDGGVGNNVLIGGAGNDSIRAGNGDSTAVYSGNRADYTVQKDAWLWSNYRGINIIDSNESRDGSDYVQGVKYIQFADGTFLVSDLLASSAPTGILPDTAEVAENSAEGTVVAELSATDPDSGDTFTYELTDDADGLFAIDGDKIVVASGASLDYESATEHTVTVKVTDSAGNTLVQTITITVTDVEENSAPTNISPETASIAENSANGTVVAAFETEDADSGDTFTYTLASNAGGRFAISGNKLVVANGSKLDYEASASHQVVVRATDAGGLWVEKTITVAVTDVNEKASVTLANRLASIKETASTASRTKVADIVVADDALGRNALSLVGRDRALFEIVGMALYLKAGAALDASKLASLEVAVAVDDAAIAGSPDATSATYKLAVADVAGLKMVHGTSASQTLTGSSGSDWFDGHGGEDTFKGGRGDDIYLVDSIGDTVVEGKNEGTDTVRASVTHTLAANVENLVLTGSSSIHGSGNGLDNVITGNSGNNKIWGHDGNDLLRGGAGNDGIDGGAGNDRLYGEAGNDTLKGGSGNDHIDGGAGMDALWGGSGKDVFDFDFISDSAVGSARDVIYDFERGKDHIDLANIDANTGRGGDQAFTWLGDKAFTGKAGELHFLDKGAEVIVQGDVNGDKVADFDILVKVGSLSSNDFVL